ncbi:MAG: cysteine hydrolase [Lachnospiraceae bacterium]|nr:cysteine hydrolase [Lachnospiraceae bacterium]
MEKKVLVVVDMQKDFIDGALGTKEAVAIVQNVADKIRNFYGEIVFTRDTHFENYMETQEGKKLPVPHCLKGTDGWQIANELKALMAEDTKIFDKPAFGSVELAEYLSNNSELETVELVGLCTDICVISNAMLIKAFMPEVNVVVDEKCCAGVTPESHSNALEAMKMCQIEVRKA